MIEHHSFRFAAASAELKATESASSPAASERTLSDAASITVNDALAKFPAAMHALNELGVDTCCGGSETLAQAASNAGVPLESLISALGPSETEQM